MIDTRYSEEDVVDIEYLRDGETYKTKITLQSQNQNL